MLVIGHRGLPCLYPENTIASFLAAILYGADGVELDVWLTADNEAVVVHDGDLRRVAGVQLEVKKSTYSELKKHSLGMGQHVPLLRDVLKAIPKDKLVFVEIKDRDAVEETYRIIRGAERLESTVILSFNPEVLREMRSLDLHVKLGFDIASVEAAEEALRLHKELGLYSIDPPVQALEVVGREKLAEYLSTVKKLGARTALWTVNEPALLEGLSGLVDIVITDDVRLFKGERP